MLQIVAYPKVYDVVIVGSGAGGGIAAYVLNKAGAKCLMLEGGSWYDTGKESKMFAWNYEAPHRGAQTSEKPYGFFVGWSARGACTGGTEAEARTAAADPQ
jgi:choline dehydrogenase-like flavoprotein